MRSLIFAALAAACSCAFAGTLTYAGKDAQDKPFRITLKDDACHSNATTREFFSNSRIAADLAKLAVYEGDNSVVLGCWIERREMVMILYVDGDRQMTQKAKFSPGA